MTTKRLLWNATCKDFYRRISLFVTLGEYQCYGFDPSGIRLFERILMARSENKVILFIGASPGPERTVAALPLKTEAH